MNNLFQKLLPELRITIQLAIPIIIGQLGIMLMGVADTIQVGHMGHLAKESVGAAGIANSIFITVAIIGIICLQIVAPMIANASHKNDFETCHNLLVASIKVAILIGIFCLIIIEWVAFNIEILHQKPEIERLIISYLHVIAVSIFPMLFFTAIKQFSDGLGHTNFAMNITLIALAINILFNHLLINGVLFFPELGLFGAGISTLISRVFMAVGIYIYVTKSSIFRPYFQTKKYSFSIKNILGENEMRNIKNILKIGIPSGFQGFFEVAVFSAAAILIGQLGATQLAAHEVAINPASITYMMVTGIAAAGGIRVGANLGNTKKMRRAGAAALFTGFGFMFICLLAFLFFNKYIAKAYISDPTVIPLAAQLIFIAGFFQLSDGVQAVALGILRGMADVNIPTIATLIAYWIIGLPIGYFLAFSQNMGVVGIWIGLSAGLTASALLLTWRFFHNLKTKKAPSIVI